MGWFIYSDCLDTALPGLFLVLEKQLLGEDSYITVYCNVQDSVRMYVAEMYVP